YDVKQSRRSLFLSEAPTPLSPVDLLVVSKEAPLALTIRTTSRRSPTLLAIRSMRVTSSTSPYSSKSTAALSLAHPCMVAPEHFSQHPHATKHSLLWCVHVQLPDVARRTVSIVCSLTDLRARDRWK